MARKMKNKYLDPAFIDREVAQDLAIEHLDNLETAICSIDELSEEHQEAIRKAMEPFTTSLTDAIIILKPDCEAIVADDDIMTNIFTHLVDNPGLVTDTLKETMIDITSAGYMYIKHDGNIAVLAKVEAFVAEIERDPFGNNQPQPRLF